MPPTPKPGTLKPVKKPVKKNNPTTLIEGPLGAGISKVVGLISKAFNKKKGGVVKSKKK